MAGHNRKSIGGHIEYSCEKVECGKKFRNSRSLKNHINLHENNITRCYFCPWGAAVGEDLHISTHLDKHFLRPRFRCSSCGKTFYLKKDRNDHFENMHEKTIGKYNCKICPFQGHSRLHLGNHMQRNHK